MFTSLYGAGGWALVDATNEATGTVNPSLTLATGANVLIEAGAVGDSASPPTAGTGFTGRSSGTTTSLAFATEDQNASTGSVTVGVTGAGTTTSTLIATSLKAPPVAIQWSYASNGTATSQAKTIGTAPMSLVGDTLLLFVALGSTTATSSVSDTNGNTWTVVGSQVVGVYTVFVYQALNINSNLLGFPYTVTATFSASVNFNTVLCELPPCRVDTSTMLFAGGTGVTLSVGPTTTNQANELMISFGGTNAGNVVPESGWAALTNGGTNGIGTIPGAITGLLETRSHLVPALR